MKGLLAARVPTDLLTLHCHWWKLFEVVWVSGGEPQRDGLDVVARETDVRTAVW